MLFEQRFLHSFAQHVITTLFTIGTSFAGSKMSSFDLLRNTWLVFLNNFRRGCNGLLVLARIFTAINSSIPFHHRFLALISFPVVIIVFDCYYDFIHRGHWNFARLSWWVRAVISCRESGPCQFTTGRRRNIWSRGFLRRRTDCCRWTIRGCWSRVRPLRFNYDCIMRSQVWRRWTWLNSSQRWESITALVFSEFVWQWSASLQRVRRICFRNFNDVTWFLCFWIFTWWLCKCPCSMIIVACLFCSNLGRWRFSLLAWLRWLVIVKFVNDNLFKSNLFIVILFRTFR